MIGSYDDVDAALRLADLSDVVTYELEHVAADVVEAIEAPRPGPARARGRWSSPRTASPSAGSSRRAGVAVAPWREVRSVGGRARRGRRARPAAPAQGCDRRLRRPRPDPDRGARGARRRAGSGSAGRPGAPLLAERELDFEAELSVVVARGLDGAVATFPVARNVHDAGILVESVAPAPVAAGRRRARRRASGRRLAEAMDLCGTLTAELFLLRDGSLVVNELAPRVHNSGHWTIEGAATSQFEQHIRAICGLGLGSTEALAPTAMVNLLGTGPTRDARLLRRRPTRSRTRPSTSTCTTSGASSNAARWGT